MSYDIQVMGISLALRGTSYSGIWNVTLQWGREYRISNGIPILNGRSFLGVSNGFWPNGGHFVPFSISLAHFIMFWNGFRQNVNHFVPFSVRTIWNLTFKNVWISNVFRIWMFGIRANSELWFRIYWIALFRFPRYCDWTASIQRSCTRYCIYALVP